MPGRLHYDSNDRDDGTIERCPRCGGEATVQCWFTPFSGMVTYYFVACDDCGLMTRPNARTVKAAIKDWNRRPKK